MWPAELYTGTCGRGHPRSPENTRIRRQNGVLKRDCRTCRNLREAEKPKPARDARAEYLRSARYRERVAAGRVVPDEVELHRLGIRLDT